MRVNPSTGQLDTTTDLSGRLKIDQTTPQTTVGTFAFPKINLLATRSSNLAPSLQSPNYTLSSGWSYGSGTLIKSGTLDGTVSIATPPTITTGHHYKLTITTTQTSGTGFISYSLGGRGSQNSSIYFYTGTYVDYITAETSSGLLLSSFASWQGSISQIELIDITDTSSSGNLLSDGKSQFVDRAFFFNGISFGPSESQNIRLNSQGYFSFGEGSGSVFANLFSGNYFGTNTLYGQSGGALTSEWAKFDASQGQYALGDYGYSSTGNYFFVTAVDYIGLTQGLWLNIGAGVVGTAYFETPQNILDDGSGNMSIIGNLTLNAKNVITDTTTGTKLGTSTSQKLGLWNTTPITQPTTAVASATFVQNSGSAVNDSSTFDGYTIKQVVKALRNMGALA